jgi:hypothetical protein
MLWRLVGAAVVLALISGGARAQLPFLPYAQTNRPSENALQQAEGERQHRVALKNIPDKKTSNDPWRTVRSPAKAQPPDRHRVE